MGWVVGCCSAGAAVGRGVGRADKAQEAEG